MSDAELYAPAMALDYEKIFADNVKKMMAAEDPPLSQPVLAGKAKMHQRTLGRIINREVTPTLEMMAKIAHGLDVGLWQLLVPGIDAKNLPALVPSTPQERALWDQYQKAYDDLRRIGGKPPPS